MRSAALLAALAFAGAPPAPAGWFVEGGADVDESCNFTMINFAALCYRLNL